MPNTAPDLENLPSHEFERLEFLGDRVLNLIVADYLNENHPSSSEGQLTDKMGATSNDYLNKIVSIHSDEIKKLCPSFFQRKDVDNDHITSDDFEALIGYLYLSENKDIRSLSKKVLGIIKNDILRFNPGINYKRQLQECVQKEWKSVPQYFRVNKQGPDHNPIFTAKVSIHNIDCDEGKGNTMQEAEQAAAFNALKKPRIKKLLEKYLQ